MNVQRNLIYEQRRKVLDGEDIRENIQGMVRDTIAETVGNIPPENADDLAERVAPLTRLFVRPGEIVYHDGMTVEELNKTLAAIAADVYARREEAFGPMPDGTPLPAVPVRETPSAPACQIDDAIQNPPYCFPPRCAFL